MKLFRKKKQGEMGKLQCIIPSYKISGNDFRPILVPAKKGDSSWHYPTQLAKILTNPLPLFIFDEIHIDRVAFHETLSFLEHKAHTKTIPDLLEKIGELNQIKFFNSEEVIGPNVDSIRKSMLQDDKDPGFRWAVQKIEDSQGQYASPNNYRFELINMNITTALLGQFKNAIPYDQSYRSLLYEQKFSREMKLVGKYKSFEDRIKEIRNYKIGQPPLKLEKEDDIKMIEKEHKSQQLIELRNKIRQNITNSKKFSDFLNYELSGPQNELSKLATGWDVFFDSAATFGTWMGAMTVTGAWAIPPMVLYAIASGKLIKDLLEWKKRDDFLWYEGLLSVLKYVRDNQQEFAWNQ